MSKSLYTRPPQPIRLPHVVCCLAFFLFTGHGDLQDEPQAERFRREAQQFLLPQLLPLQELHDVDPRLHEKEHARYAFAVRLCIIGSQTQQGERARHA